LISWNESVKSYRDDGKGAAKLMSGGLNLSEEETLTTMDEIIVKDKSEQAEYLGKNGELAKVLKKTADFLYDQKSLDKKQTRRFLNREFYQNYMRENSHDNRTVWKKKSKNDAGACRAGF